MKSEKPTAESAPPSSDVSFIAKWTRLLLAATPFIVAVGALATGVFANLGVSQNSDNAQVSYQALAEKVNKLSEDVAYIKGVLAARQAARSEKARDDERKLLERFLDSHTAITEVVRSANDGMTDIYSKSLALPASLTDLIQHRAQ